MDNRWIWILLFCLAVTLAAWQLRERQSEGPSAPTLSGRLQPLSTSGRLWKTLAAKLDPNKPRHAANKEEAIALALRTAYGEEKSWANRSLETRWLPVSLLHTADSNKQQVALLTTVLPNDGLLALFSVDAKGYTLLDLTPELSRIDSVSLEQAVDDPAQEIAITHTYDELVGAFFKITLCTLFKWSDAEQKLVAVWEHPLELEQYDPASNFVRKQTKRSQIQFGSNEVTVYEVTTEWRLDRELDVYQATETSAENIKYIWDQQKFNFKAHSSSS